MRFKELFCKHFACTPDNYTKQVFFRCVAVKTPLWLEVCWWFEWRVVVESKKLITEIATARSLDEIHESLRFYNYELEALGLENSSLRISADDLVRLCERMPELSSPAERS